MLVGLEYRSRDSAVGVVTRLRAGYLRNLVPIPEGAKICRRVRKVDKSDRWLRRVCPSTWNNSAPTGQILLNLIFE
jgi:hypothetical protein